MSCRSGTWASITFPHFYVLSFLGLPIRRRVGRYCSSEEAHPIPAASSSSLKVPAQETEAVIAAGRKDVEFWLEKYMRQVLQRSRWGFGHSRPILRLKALDLIRRTLRQPQQIRTRTRMHGRKSTNPRSILRKWVFRDVIKKYEQDPYQAQRILAKVVEIAGGRSSCGTTESR